MKKLLAIILATLMLVTALPVQSFAISDLFNTEKAPSVVSIEFADSLPISLKEVTQNSYDDKYYLSRSAVEYQYNVKLSDGTEVVSGEREHIVLEDAVISLLPEKDKQGYEWYFYSYVNKAEAEEAFKNGETTVTVYSKATVYDYTGFYTEEKYTYTFENEKVLVPSFVETIKPVSGAPEFFYDGAIYPNFENTVFELTYSDGTTKQTKADYNSEKNEYSIDGYTLYGSISQKDKTIDISYLDADRFSYSVEVRDNPFESMKVNSAILDDEYNLESVSYTITWKDGRTQTYEKTGGVMYLGAIGTIDVVDGYIVICFFSLEYPESRTKEGTLEVNLSVGGVRDEGKFPIPAITHGLPITSFFVRVSEITGTIIAHIANFCYAVMRKIIFNEDILENLRMHGWDV